MRKPVGVEQPGIHPGARVGDPQDAAAVGGFRGLRDERQDGAGGGADVAGMVGPDLVQAAPLQPALDPGVEVASAPCAGAGRPGRGGD